MIREYLPEPVPARPVRRPAVPERTTSIQRLIQGRTDATAAATLGMLQRTAGNSAVQRALAGLALQRCGPVPCDCPPEERAAKEAAAMGSGQSTEAGLTLQSISSEAGAASVRIPAADSSRRGAPVDRPSRPSALPTQTASVLALQRDARNPAMSAVLEGPLRMEPAPTVQRSSVFDSTLEIHHRVLKSRVFRVTEGGVVVTAHANWEPSEEWAGDERPRCDASTFRVTLSDEGRLWDTEYGTCDFRMGAPMSRAWGNIPTGNYYLIISVPVENPNCYLKGVIEVDQQGGLTEGTCTVPPPGPMEVVHTALDLAGLIPALGAIPDGVNAGIYLIEGNWVEAGLSAIAMVPAFGDGASVVNMGKRTAVRVSGREAERIGKDRLAAGIREARAAERRAAADAVLERAKRVGLPGLRSCRVGSLHCPIYYLREEFAGLYRRRRSAEFSRFLRDTPEIDLNLSSSLRREQTILTGDEMYRQFLAEVPRSEWTAAFRKAVDSARQVNVDYREIVVQGRRDRWPLDAIGDPWVVHHDPPLTWVSAESSQWWHPMPYRIHDAVHGWWTQLERAIKNRVPREIWPRIFEEPFDFREF